MAAKNPSAYAGDASPLVSDDFEHAPLPFGAVLPFHDPVVPSRQ